MGAIRIETAELGQPIRVHLPGPVGSAVNLANRPAGWVVVDLFDEEPKRRERDALNEQLEEQLRHFYPGYEDAKDGLTCGQCSFRIVRADGSTYCDLRHFRIRDADPACDQIFVAAA